MSRERCCHRRRGAGPGPCSCEMGNLYRYCEPIVLLTLARLGHAHGYQVAQAAEPLAVTHAGLDNTVVYQTLRRLEDSGYVISSWETGGRGPARRIYTLTDTGHEHLREWAAVLEPLAASLDRLARDCRAASDRTEREDGPAVLAPE